MTALGSSFERVREALVIVFNAMRHRRSRRRRLRKIRTRNSVRLSKSKQWWTVTLLLTSPQTLFTFPYTEVVGSRFVARHTDERCEFSAGWPLLTLLEYTHLSSGKMHYWDHTPVVTALAASSLYGLVSGVWIHYYLHRPKDTFTSDLQSPSPPALAMTWLVWPLLSIVFMLSALGWFSPMIFAVLKLPAERHSG